MFLLFFVLFCFFFLSYFELDPFCRVEACGEKFKLRTWNL